MNATQEAVIQEVMDTGAGKNSTHYMGCWKYHASCLASVLHDLEGTK